MASFSKRRLPYLGNIFVFVLVFLLTMTSVTVSRVIVHNRFNRAVDWDTCEFGSSYEHYDEDCPNGARQLLPCNPGQLKVSECIGQGGDTSRTCDPCPQKTYQSSYNRCTRCRECSECGPNEYIKVQCSDESDTVCASIIPPDPIPATTPRLTTTTIATTHATTQGSTECLTYRSVSTTEVFSPRSNRTQAVTYRNSETTESPRLLTTQAGRNEPSATCRGTEAIGLTASVAVINCFLVVIVIILVIKYRKQKRNIKHLKILLRNYEGIKLISPDSKKTHNQINSENEYEVSSKTSEMVSYDGGTVRLTVQVNERNAASEINLYEDDEDRRELQISGRRDCESTGSKTPLEIGNDERSRSSPDLVTGDAAGNSRGMRIPDRTPDFTTANMDSRPTDFEMPSGVEENSGALHQQNVQRDLSSGAMESPHYEDLPQDDSRERHMNVPLSTSSRGCGESTESCGTGPEETNGPDRGARPELSTSKPKETDPLMHPQAFPKMHSRGTKEQKGNTLNGF